MDFYYTTKIYSGTIRYKTAKNCFLAVPNKWIDDIVIENLIVFKVKYGENQEKQIYVSCDKGASFKDDLESKIYINQQFAEKLDMKEKDLVILQPILSNLPTAVSVTLEPVTFDDWEIMEANSKYIESNLMNQIRVIWTDQIFPIWIHNNYCFYSKVVSCEPNHNPVVLHENSEVRIIPKDRNNLNSTLNTKNEERKSDYLQFHCLRYSFKSDRKAEASDSDDNADSSLNKEEINLTKSIAALAPNFLTSWFSSPREESMFEGSENFEEIFDFQFNSILRVLPFSNPHISLPTVVQATTVFISASSYVTCCGDKEIPPCFVAVLEKFPLPGRKKKQFNDNMIKASNLQSDGDSQLKYGNNSRENSLDSKNCSVTEQRPFDLVCVTVIVVKSAEEDEYNLPTSLFTYRNAIVVPRELKRNLSLEVGCLVNLKSISTKPLSSYRLIFHPVTLLNPNITEAIVHDHFIRWAFGEKRKRNTYVISDGTLVKLRFNGKKSDFFIHLEVNESHSKGNTPSGSIESSKSPYSKEDTGASDYIILTYKILKKASIKIGDVMCSTIYDDRPYLLKENGVLCELKVDALNKLGGLKELSTKPVEDIEFWLKLKPLSYISHYSSCSGCMLICGPKGVGKSSFANALCKKFSSYPYYVLVRNMQCFPLKGKRVDFIAKKWDDIVSEAIYGQPSLILFDDLDYIASAPMSHEQENGPEGIYFASISQAFIRMMNRILASESNIVVIVTSQSLHSLHPSLVNTKGRHIFQSIIEVNPPNTDQRTDIILSLLCNKPHISKNTLRDINIIDIATKTDGYVVQDLSVLVERAVHAAWVRLGSSEGLNEMKLKNTDFDVALKGLLPSSLRGISLQIEDQRSWNDVGGLKNIKKILQQIIMWPTKYKEIYKNYSLKPQTNILLYGAPGTGKTLLAGVVAHECNLNFISIKGPELLSKYIGASEQAIRDLFKRATTARPCILFFDEFDSIAPRRGHDSTGVTDRVVNQLLTQLDGVESLEGVHVLAATSRPELIDPALLRPGRLDKCLLCPLPDKEERVEILNCLSAKLPLGDDIDFDSIASLTANFSGADLQALLYSAHIEALHEIQNASTKHYSSSSDESDYLHASDKLIFIPSLEEGLQKPSYEDGKRIVQEMVVVHDNYFESHKTESRRHSTLVLTITQRHLLKIASEMKPSVSVEERMRYECVFKNFQNVLSGEPQVVAANEKRVTLA